MLIPDNKDKIGEACKNLIGVRKKNIHNYNLSQNSDMGDGKKRNVLEQHGLRKTNDHEKTLVNFCPRNALIIANAWLINTSTNFACGKVQGVSEDIK